MACSYCFEHKTKDSLSMSCETATKAIGLLMKECHDGEWMEVIFIGGEPLLKFDLIQEVVQYVETFPDIVNKHKKIGFTITTNGTLIEEKHLRFFREKDIRFLLSLDGAKEDNDTYRKMRNGQSQYQLIRDKMPLFKSFQPWQGARVTVLPQTARRLAENISSLHRDLKINQFVIGFATGINWTDEQIGDYCLGLKEVFEFLLQDRIDNEHPRLRISLMEVGLIDEAYAENVTVNWGCGAGSGRISVGPDGTLYGCTKLAFASRSQKWPLPLGNVFDGFIGINNRLMLLNHTEHVRHKCQKCQLAKQCNGGCYAANLTDMGNIFVASDTYCKLIFAQMLAAEYARHRLRELGIKNIYWPSEECDANASNVP